MAATQKTVTRQTLIGEAGIALIQQRALEMGYLFHPRRVDHGIDGHLDLVDSRSGALLNLTLLVQSKASNAKFANETEDSFHYLCNAADLDLWLAGNAPVLLIFSHPESQEAWWVDVKAAMPTPERRATRRIDVNKLTQRFNRDAAANLLSLGQPQGLGLYLRPPPKPETVETNLLPIVELPPTIFVAPSAARDYPEAGRLLGPSRNRDVWILRDGNVMSFHDLRQGALSALAASNVEVHDTAEWAHAVDEDKRWAFTDLLSRTIQGSYPELRWHKSRKHMHFLGSRDLSPRRLPSGSANRKRTVFSGHGDNGAGQPGFFSHAALKLRPRCIAGQYFLQLEPDYCFSSDGFTEHKNADLLLAGIKRLDKHAALKGWVRMWALFLRGPEDLFSPVLPVKFGDLVTFELGEGIDEHLWGPMPVEYERSDDHPGGPDEREHGDAQAAVYDADLLTLLAASEDEPGPAEPLDPSAATLRADHHRRRRRATREVGSAG